MDEKVIHFQVSVSSCVSPSAREGGRVFFVLFKVELCRYLRGMNVFEAIRQMKVLTDKGQTFSFSFMSYSIDKNRSHGIVTVEHAKLRAGNRKERTRFNDYLLNYTDMDTLEDKTCWQPLLLEFNGIMLELN